jgi:hypothetical protein
MSLKTQLSSDMKTAMKAGEKDRLGVIRLMQAAIQQREVDERIELDETQVMAVVEKMLKQRRDSGAVREGRSRGSGRGGALRDRRHPGLPARAAGRGRAGRPGHNVVADTGARARRTWAGSWRPSRGRGRAAPTWARSRAW